MTNVRCLPLLAVFAVLGAEAAAEPQLETSGSVRFRYETISGQPRTGFSPSDDLVNVRTRLFAEYDVGVLRIGGELYDSRTLLADADLPLSTNEVNALEPVQAYVAADFDAPWGRRTTLQAGRFTLNLGSRRLVAADDYRNTTNGYTGLRFDTALPAGASATAIYVLPQLRLPIDDAALRDNRVALDRESRDLSLWGGIVTAPFGVVGAALQPSFFHLMEADQSDLPTRNRRLDTIGLRYFREPVSGRLDFDVEAMRQTGTIRASAAEPSPTLDVSASYVHAELGYRAAHVWKPRIALEYDEASGDEPGGDYQRFDTLFGMRRAELAPAGLYNAVGRANIAAFGVRVELEPSARWDAFAALRSVSLESDTDAFSTTGVRDATGASGSDAGVQLEARVRTWLKPDAVRLEANAVYLAKGAFLREAPNTPSPNDTSYFAVDLTFQF